MSRADTECNKTTSEVGCGFVGYASVMVRSRVPVGLVLAAGEGRRLADCAVPKPFAQVAGLSLAEHCLVALKAAAVEHVIVVLGSKGIEVRKHFEQLACR